ncbi:Flavodoxin [Planococcus massiliensis]|uniref:Flavodoxin n=1 Tax=Planococcus massiliensis TaxID=1499687 RepID=A0A098EGE4_9BACL|nr:flavodoxin domain-containing protein [Planococcus massiliensis]CEG21353.1 Flavodoxin [Planococcus massiliensis]
MDSTNYKPKIAVVYASVTGNTKAVAEMIGEVFQAKELELELWPAKDFVLTELSRFDIVLVGTYTWGNGEVPKELYSLFDALENQERKNLVTAVFGTGDSFFAEFCGAVNRFRDMLFVHTTLAATLKIELQPQKIDKIRCEKFIESALKKHIELKTGNT